MPSVLIRRLTLSSEPSVLLSVASTFIPTRRAHALPCSVLSCAPSLPACNTGSPCRAGPWPETWRMLPTRTVGLYLAIGLGGIGSVILSSCKRFSADIGFLHALCEIREVNLQ